MFLWAGFYREKLVQCVQSEERGERIKRFFAQWISFFIICILISGRVQVFVFHFGRVALVSALCAGVVTGFMGYQMRGQDCKKGGFFKSWWGQSNKFVLISWLLFTLLFMLFRNDFFTTEINFWEVLQMIIGSGLLSVTCAYMRSVNTRRKRVDITES